jgi:ribosomal protein S18 acetylase RimI-like enzyme
VHYKLPVSKALNIYYKFAEMIHFNNPAISIATIDNIPTIKTLLDSAYRGEDSKKGWTTEAHLIAGDQRTTTEDLQETIQKEGSVLLVYLHDKRIAGCVNLQKNETKVYLGMLSVSPDIQGKGIGKQLLAAAEEYAKQLNCVSVYMTVISVRHELIAWYQRYGYTDTGKRKAFEEDGKSGKHLQKMEFMVLEKKL